MHKYTYAHIHIFCSLIHNQVKGQLQPLVLSYAVSCFLMWRLWGNVKEDKCFLWGSLKAGDLTLNCANSLRVEMNLGFQTKSLSGFSFSFFLFEGETQLRDQSQGLVQFWKSSATWSPNTTLCRVCLFWLHTPLSSLWLLLQACKCLQSSEDELI